MKGRGGVMKGRGGSIFKMLRNLTFDLDLENFSLD